MKAVISRSKIAGKTAAPASKSYTIRALACAGMAHGESLIRKPLLANDTRAALSVLSRLGATITEEKSDWRVKGGDLLATTYELNCRESAATLRFMTSIACTIHGISRLTFGPGLAKRPISPLIAALWQLGAVVRLEADAVVVEGGELRGGEANISRDISSQYVSAILLAAPRTEIGVMLKMPFIPRSSPYIDMTLDCMKRFGIRAVVSAGGLSYHVPPQTYMSASFQVEGDWSQASYLLALGVLAGEVLVTNLNAESLQGDRAILRLLQQFGARFSQRGGSVMVNRSSLHGVNADLSNCIDLLPTVAVIAAVAEGETVLRGIDRARLKESDRVASLRQELTKMGIRVIEESDTLRIIGTKPRGAIIDSHGDHRIAMSFALLGAVVGDMVIEDAACVEKTYPEFWEVFQDLGGQVKFIE
jgi:3-phosphoshikimate 1-carboxyvinyltransferase